MVHRFGLLDWRGWICCWMGDIRDTPSCSIDAQGTMFIFVQALDFMSLLTICEVKFVSIYIVVTRHFDFGL